MTIMRTGFAAALVLGLALSAAPAQDRGTPGPDAAPANGTAAASEFGVDITLPETPVIAMNGNGTWDSAFDTLVDAFKTVYAFMDKQGLQPSGNPMMIYTSADDTGFSFQAAVPIAAAPVNSPMGDITVATSPAGRAFKFVHRGSYDGMENTYEAITNFFVEKNIEAQDMFIEQYVTDPRTTPEGQLVINVLVPVK
jgi:effector-binding domain-containing protein